MIGDELAEKTVGIVFRVGKSIATKVLQAEMRAALKILKETGELGLSGVAAVSQKVSKQEISIEKLSSGKSALDAIPVDKNEIAGFDKHAKRHNLDYSLVRSVHDKNQYTLYFRKADVEKFNAAATDFIADKDLDRPGFREKLQQANAVAKNRNRARAQEREKTKVKGRQR